MLNSMSHLTGAKLTATDGDIGTVKDFFSTTARGRSAIWSWTPVAGLKSVRC